MNRSIVLSAIALGAAMLIAACSTGGASPSAAGSTLEGTWQWTASTETQPAAQAVVPDPENYTITFEADGTFEGKADCNQIAGTWTSSGSNLTITVGPSTLAMCPEESQGDLYVTYLGQVASYAISGTDLTMTFADDAGTMTFTKA